MPIEIGGTVNTATKTCPVDVSFDISNSPTVFILRHTQSHAELFNDRDVTADARLLARIKHGNLVSVTIGKA